MPRPQCISILVTQTHIAQGSRCSAQRCPIAVALNANTGESWEVTNTHVYRLTFFTRGPASWKLPARVRSWIKHFDAYESVEPLKLSVPIHLLRT